MLPHFVDRANADVVLLEARRTHDIATVGVDVRVKDGTGGLSALHDEVQLRSEPRLRSPPVLMCPALMSSSPET
jgi:hypothetical protein